MQALLLLIFCLIKFSMLLKHNLHNFCMHKHLYIKSCDLLSNYISLQTLHVSLLTNRPIEISSLENYHDFMGFIFMDHRTNTMHNYCAQYDACTDVIVIFYKNKKPIQLAKKTDLLNKVKDPKNSRKKTMEIKIKHTSFHVFL